jgi:hypothetical protein
VVCRECGASVPVDGTCRGHFDALLALESEVSASGVDATWAHFYAVSAYVLQHPFSMRYTAESLSWLRSAVAAALVGDADVATLRRWARRHADNVRITRRDVGHAPSGSVTRWSKTVVEVLAGRAGEYRERVQMWAASVIADLDGADAQREEHVR